MEPEKKSNGAFIGLIVIIIILVIGGIYIWMSNQKEAQQIQNPQAQAEAVTSQDSASLDALDKDLQTTDTNAGIDASTVN
jgi:flagellar basal body-associated protein FliL